MQNYADKLRFKVVNLFSLNAAHVKKIDNI